MNLADIRDELVNRNYRTIDEQRDQVDKYREKSDELST
jgi:hypothetical protein